MVLIPTIKKVGGLHPRVLCSAGGLSAVHTGQKLEFDRATANEDDVFADPAVGAVFILTRHDQHAAQVVKALKAGKHVFVEKPLALTADEVEEIGEALAEAKDRILTVGFNRRFSPAAAAVRQFFAGVTAPLTVSVRFNVGAIPAEHWTQDEDVGGGRLVGEACHAIDLATFLVGSPPVRVFAESVGGPAAPSITDDQCFITLRHANGSVSNVAYLAGGDKGFAKERVEVLGGGRLAVIDDWKDVTTSVGGKATRSKPWRQDKGHAAEVEAFARSITAGGPAPIPWADLRAVSLAAILVVRSIREGVPLEISAEPPGAP
jgi:predicted dehydrogenase